MIIKKGLWDTKIKDAYEKDTIASEFLKNPRENFTVRDRFLLFKGRIYIPNKIRGELI
jgi:hypothetical protein